MGGVRDSFTLTKYGKVTIDIKLTLLCMLTHEKFSIPCN